MTIHNKPNYNIGVWASNGTITQPTSEKIEEGHVVEKPKYEIVNYIENKQDVGIAYLLQKGIPDWDSLTEYPENAFIQYNGVVYRALSQNLDKQPNINIGIWTTAWAGADLSAEVTNIKTIDGYLPHYVRKSQPEMTGKAIGVGYTANSGLINTGAESVGYSFNNNLRDGLFHNGISPVVQNDGTVVAKFEDILGNVNDNSINVATSAWVQSLISSIKNTFAPVGSIVAMATQVVPDGYLECNGNTVSRTQYSALFSVIGTQFGAGDGSTTFKLPDLRGEFIRGWDNGRGVDAGRQFASSQNQSIEAHKHYSVVNVSSADVNGSTTNSLTDVGSGSYSLSYSSSEPNVSKTSVEGGSETRPRNVALVYIIKY